MTDLLESASADVDTASAPTLSTISSPPPAFPPPAPSGTGDGRRLTALATLAALALAIAVGMGLLWMSASSAASDAESARDVALTEAEAGVARQSDLEAELATAREDLDASQTAAETLTAERNDVAASLEAGSADVTQLRTQVGDLTANNEQMATQIATLREELQSAQSDLDSAAAVTADPVVIPFDIAANPDFARYIGETLSSRNGSSRLGQAQSECFGTALVNDIGLDGLGQGLILAASAADNNNVVGAMQRAAGTCNINLSLIF